MRKIKGTTAAAAASTGYLPNLLDHHEDTFRKLNDDTNEAQGYRYKKLDKNVRYFSMGLVECVNSFYKTPPGDVSVESDFNNRLITYINYVATIICQENISTEQYAYLFGAISQLTDLGVKNKCNYITTLSDLFIGLAVSWLQPREEISSIEVRYSVQSFYHLCKLIREVECYRSALFNVADFDFNTLLGKKIRELLSQLNVDPFDTQAIANTVMALGYLAQQKKCPPISDDQFLLLQRLIQKYCSLSSRRPCESIQIIQTHYILRCFLNRKLLEQSDLEKLEGDPGKPEINDLQIAALSILKKRTEAVLEELVCGYHVDVRCLNKFGKPIIIEFDGDHHRDENGDLRVKDQHRDHLLESNGYTIYRFKNSDIKSVELLTKMIDFILNFESEKSASAVASTKTQKMASIIVDSEGNSYVFHYTRAVPQAPVTIRRRNIQMKAIENLAASVTENTASSNLLLSEIDYKLVQALCFSKIYFSSALLLYCFCCHIDCVNNTPKDPVAHLLSLLFRESTKNGRVHGNVLTLVSRFVSN